MKAKVGSKKTFKNGYDFIETFSSVDILIN